MSAAPAPGSPAPRGWIGALRLLRQAWSGDTGFPADPAPHETARPRAPAGRPIRVLVADDNPVNLMVISALMEGRGLVPVLATHGAEAVALACEGSFDLILMDLQMPVLDGLAATQAIRRFEATCSRPAVPVLAYSSMVPGDGVLARHGLNGTLAKPCQDDDLEDCLTRWCPTYRPAPGPHTHPSDNPPGQW